MKFIHDNFMLENKWAEALYHQYAKALPIIDFHNHLPPQQIAEEHCFENLTQIWLAGDHYKWRAMRTFGIAEKYCTGEASDKEKFLQWAKVVPYTIGNPLHHWTHLELSRFFGIDDFLTPDTAENIYEKCSEKLRTKEFSCLNILRNWQVELLCTTDDPADSLEHHQKHGAKNTEVAALPTWRADKILKTEDITILNRYFRQLSEVANIEIVSMQTLKDALKKRHDFFASVGCMLSDSGLDTFQISSCSDAEAETIFAKILQQTPLSPNETIQYKTYLMLFLGALNAEKGWTQQFHIGALRNNNSRAFRQLGADTGFDSIADFAYAEPLSALLDALNRRGQLAKTILYNLNPKDTEMIVTMLGNFQQEGTRGHMQYGAGWWFLDQKEGMENHLKTLSALGLLSLFVGMVTDSRSFMSYTRHEYFRRILCNFFGTEIAKGTIPNDMVWVGKIVQDICYYNSKRYLQG